MELQGEHRLKKQLDKIMESKLKMWHREISNLVLEVPKFEYSRAWQNTQVKVTTYL